MITIKQEIKNELIRLIEAEIAIDESQLAALVSQANDAPGAMQSHSDTTKSQFSNMAAQHQASIADRRESLAILKELEMTALTNEAINVGSMVKAQREVGETWYIMMPIGGGRTITTSNMSITVITPGTPIGDLIFGKMPGDTVNLFENTLSIMQTY